MTQHLIDLIRQGALLDDRALRTAAERCEKTGEDLASSCLALGLLPERELVHLLSRLHGFPGVEMGKSVIPTANLELIPRDLARGTPVLAVADIGEGLVVAVADPTDQRLVVQLRTFTRRQVLPHVVVPTALVEAIDGLRHAKLQGLDAWRGARAGNVPARAGGRAEVVRHEDGKAEEDVPTIAGEPIEADAPVELVSILDPSFEAADETPELPPPPSLIRPAPAPQAAAAKKRKEKTTVRLGGIGQGKVALIADDSAEIRSLLRRVLEPFDLALLEAGDGKRALDLAREAQPNLVILDAMLPRLHGFEVCRAIKGDPALRKAAVLMVSGIYTGWKIDADVRETLGVDGFFEKPFRIDDLQRAVRKLLISAAGLSESAKAQRAAALELCAEAIEEARAGRTAQAVHLFKRAAEKDPFSAEPHLYLGQLHRRTRQPYQAVAALERAVELRPDLDGPLAELAVVYELLGFKRTARELYERALEVCKEPGRADPLRQRLARLSGQIGGGEPQ